MLEQSSLLFPSKKKCYEKEQYKKLERRLEKAEKLLKKISRITGIKGDENGKR